MGIETIIGVGASLLGGAMSSSSASKAADAQRAAAAESAAVQRDMAEKSIAAQREMFDIGRADLAPYREGGTTAQNQLMTLLGIGGDQNAQGYGKYARDFSMSDFTTDPGYQFRLEQGMRALNASAAAKGMGMSGANIKGATEYGQNLGSQEYQNAYNRAFNAFQTNRANQLDPLFKLYSGGQASAAGSAAQAGNLGQNLGQTYTGLGQNLGQAAVAGGNAQASGYLNQANAINNALSQGASSYMQNQYLNRLGGGGSNLSYLSPSQGGMGFV
jgi:hypothetical protein